MWGFGFALFAAGYGVWTRGLKYSNYRVLAWVLTSPKLWGFRIFECGSLEI